MKGIRYLFLTVVCTLALVFFATPVLALSPQEILNKDEQKKERTASRAAALEDMRGKLQELKARRVALREELKEKRQEIREKIKARKEELKQRREEQKEKRNDISEKRKEKLEDFISNVIEKQHASLERLNNIAERIQTRIDKLREKGEDVTGAQSALNACVTNEDSLQSGLEESVIVPDEADEDNNGIDEAKRAVTQSLKANRDKIVAYHKCLVDVVKIVKPLNAGERGGTQSAR